MMNEPKRHYRALPGYSMTLAVYEGMKYIGFIPVTELGFDTVHEWKLAQKKVA